ncbi:hemerythrin domain-containing protein [Catalinimonas niigatensis]|uniref:hemerythrin domain-containing protein n=1 Tax=Catalinimonas niigatensis TaxID=1397264 RepID=UPI002667060C|nr:hemerythrin domain-containing protein [Catalinimonas niigatensis]WPP50607.1 hemerythrin domain-containing protein [Catalinimonas niigatensis]
MKIKPIKRNEALQPISREHHQSLLLCWKIRTGFSKGVDVARMKKYADWFFKNHIQTHFDIEEKYIFPILGNEHEGVKKALSEHRRLTRLFENKDEIEKSLSRIEEELEAHIRFEERILFNEIQETATDTQLKSISEHHTESKFQENTEDMYWK